MANFNLAMAPHPSFDGTRQWADLESDGEHMDFRMRAVRMNGETHTAEVPLDPDVLTNLCRRSRLRLRDVQMTCQAIVKLDRLRGVLRVTGTDAAIQAVRRQLESLGGPRRLVPSPVWAELMRSRKMGPGSSQATVARLQEESGCRIHIERSNQEVRLFGPGEAVERADQLLSELAAQCGEEAVLLPGGDPPSAAALEELAHRCHITMRMEEDKVIVLGLRPSVVEGAKQLRRYFTDPAVRAAADHAAAEASREAEEAAQGSRIAEGDGRTTLAVQKSASAAARNDPANLRMACRSQDSMTTQATLSDYSQCNDHAHRHCSTCGAQKFCGSCGARTGFPKRGRGSRSTTASGGSERSRPGTPEALDMQQAPQQWYQYMPMARGGAMQPVMSMGQHGTAPVCMVQCEHGGAMMQVPMMWVPASACQDSSWMSAYAEQVPYS
mmetsp:Transcript_2623/g.6772  ORF Transcript_2623/g.6772 Transcript_2623/m.6772 type:complete len:440 (+) Transcript_2623:61-1380(+)